MLRTERAEMKREDEEERESKPNLILDSDDWEEIASRREREGRIYD